MTDLHTIGELLYKRSLGTITDSEWQTLDAWASLSPGNRLLLEEVEEEEILSRKLTDFHPDNQQQNRDEILAKIMEQRGQRKISPVHRVHFLKTAWVRYAAAIIILFGIGAYLWNTQQKEKPLITDTKPVPVKNDVAPGSTKATLTLSDGRKVELTPSTGNIAETGTNIQNTNGRLAYGKAEKVVFNTMSTPRGGQYQLTLPDGTNVWLNAASSITYPTAFTSNTREVTITGEAYFDVTKNPSKPFVVKTPKEEITVLGTQFNVNAYADEVAMKTSLVEGSVKIGAHILKPGQAFIDGKVTATNLQQDIAWKNGVFDFNQLTIEQAARQIARWYDVDIVFQGAAPEVRLFGKVHRNVGLLELIEGMEGDVARFELTGRKLIVKPL